MTTHPDVSHFYPLRIPQQLPILPGFLLPVASRANFQLARVKHLISGPYIFVLAAAVINTSAAEERDCNPDKAHGEKLH